MNRIRFLIPDHHGHLGRRPFIEPSFNYLFVNWQKFKTFRAHISLKEKSSEDIEQAFTCENMKAIRANYPRFSAP